MIIDRIGMVVWMLHAVWCGEEAGARNLAFFCVRWVPRGRLFLSIYFGEMVILIYVILYIFWNYIYKSHSNGYMNIACRMLSFNYLLITHLFVCNILLFFLNNQILIKPC